MLLCFSHVQLFATPWTVACQASLSMGFSRQEHWSGLPCPPPRYVYTHLKTYTHTVWICMCLYTLCIYMYYWYICMCRYRYPCVHTHTHFSCSLSWGGKDSDTPDATITASILLLFGAPFSRKRNQDFLNKCLIIGLGNVWDDPGAFCSTQIGKC